MFLLRTLTAAVLCCALSPAQAGAAGHVKVKAKSEVKSNRARLIKLDPSGRMVASVYWQGARVATGRKFDPDGMTVAHRTLPFGTRLVVSYGRNMAEVVVNDRGPFVRGREIDLTRGVAKALHFSGVGKVRVAYWPPLPRTRPGEAQPALELSSTDQTKAASSDSPPL
jgi:rare lipoprotein A